jgi:hypothetical protein
MRAGAMGRPSVNHPRRAPAGESVDKRERQVSLAPL